MAEKSELPAPSPEFLEALTIAGSISTDCEFCGRTFYEDKGDDSFFNKGELEELREKNRLNPSKVVAMDFVRYTVLSGKQYVIDCPCNTASKYENLFWEHRGIIRDYFKNRTESELESARRDSKLAQEVSNLDL